jgi:hypothetical protein
MFFWEFGGACDGQNIYRHLGMLREIFFSVPTGSPPGCILPATCPIPLRYYTGRLVLYLFLCPSLLHGLYH